MYTLILLFALTGDHATALSSQILPTFYKNETDCKVAGEKAKADLAGPTDSTRDGGFEKIKVKTSCIKVP